MKGINSVVSAPAIVPATKDSKRKPAAASKEKKPKKAKGVAAKKDPNLPKRPPTPFFLFMSEFRQEYKKANPDVKGVGAVAKAGGEKWKSMTDNDKKAYTNKAALLKAAYAKDLAEYEETQTAEGSGETKSEMTEDADQSTLDDM
ncbi:high mobility group B protein 1-like [Selaginella moellendorffii]|uniref:high mobility group B protein 1-like n=1 Tax=Selaginella moellendorffii TaxID=88036 RepID=UPI000D1CDE96|nr:high mobility group B protein 1-like [Selaginella moellendorffii]XP_024518455.1 high mobility group B protein 1-like [Selaginella moellendorffii]|eukprot:XP_024516469.1 high mobility group B protein 1-like [Selaginella moellendorffii]